ncbi:hypothetical protein I7I48_06392 [Histoplasma ohiense]|nr:hypothetical protein I7I48_06392 [Histoplasma ohiense (nom. inval.)]
MCGFLPPLVFGSPIHTRFFNPQIATCWFPYDNNLNKIAQNSFSALVACCDCFYCCYSLHQHSAAKYRTSTKKNPSFLRFLAFLLSHLSLCLFVSLSCCFCCGALVTGLDRLSLLSLSSASLARSPTSCLLFVRFSCFSTPNFVLNKPRETKVEKKK